MAFDGTLKFDTAIDQSGFESGIGKLGSLASKGMAAVAGAVTVASGAMAALGKSALDAYADYEQLTGGVSTLFGAQEMSLNEYAASVGKSVDAVRGEYDKLIAAQDSVMQNAAEAFRTAGMSQNEYMETVTSFSAALISSLGGDTLKAAEVADRAIVDMADNANKMGSSMESIQNAYQGFAKQNYTMLDNLKLGYGGTKSEMERLLADAEAISGVHYDISSYADVVEAIHVIQTEMGITGTTAKEASETISGSLASLGAAWSNVLVGIADDGQDFDKLIDDLVSSAATAADNILPRVETIIGGISSLISSMSDVLVEAVLGLTEYIPDFITAGVDVVNALAEGLAENAPMLSGVAADIAVQLTGAFFDIAPKLAVIALDLVTALAEGIAEAAPELVSSAAEGISQLIAGLNAALPRLITAAGQILTALVAGLADNVDILLDGALLLLQTLAESLLENIGPLTEAVVELITELALYLVDNSDQIIETTMLIIGEVAQAIIENAPQLIAACVLLLGSIANLALEWLGKLLGIVGDFWGDIFDDMSESLGKVFTKISEWGADIIDAGVRAAQDFVGGIVDFVTELPDKLGDLLGDVIDSVVTWGSDLLQKGKDAASDLVTSITDGIASLPEDLLNIGKNLVTGLWNGITSMGSWLWDQISGFGSDIIDGFKSAFGINSPSRVMRDSIGKYLAQGLGVGFTEELPDVAAAASEAMQSIRLSPDIELNAHIDRTAVDSFRALENTGGEYVPSPTSEIVSTVNNYSTVNNNTAPEDDRPPINVTVIAKIGEDVIAEGVAPYVDEQQGAEITLKERGLTT